MHVLDVGLAFVVATELSHITYSSSYSLAVGGTLTTNSAPVPLLDMTVETMTNEVEE